MVSLDSLLSFDGVVLLAAMSGVLALYADAGMIVLDVTKPRMERLKMLMPHIVAIVALTLAAQAYKQ